MFGRGTASPSTRMYQNLRFNSSGLFATLSEDQQFNFMILRHFMTNTLSKKPEHVAFAVLSGSLPCNIVYDLP